MADFPNAIAEPRVVENVDGVTYEAEQTTRLFAEDINNANEEIVAIEETIGVDPLGPSDSIADFLNNPWYRLSFSGTRGIASTGEYTVGAYGVGLNVPSSTPSYNSFRFTMAPSLAYFGANIPMRLRWTGRWAASGNPNTNVGYYYGYGEYTAVGSSDPYDFRGFGFQCVGNVVKAFIRGAEDETTAKEVLSDAISVSINASHEYEVRYENWSSSITFYIDGTLVATLSLSGFEEEFSSSSSVFSMLIHRHTSGGSNTLPRACGVEYWSPRSFF